MRKLATAIAAMVLCVSATAGEPTKEGRYSSSIPPERYRGLGAVIAVFVPFHLLNEACGVPREEGKTLLGCATRTKEGAPIVFLPDSCPAAINGELYARVVCHEIAHAKGGWSGDHEF